MSVKDDWKIIVDDVCHNIRPTTRPTDTEMSLRLLLVCGLVTACIITAYIFVLLIKLIMGMI